MSYEVWTAELVMQIGGQPDWDAVSRAIEVVQVSDLERSLGWDWDPLGNWGGPDYTERDGSEDLTAVLPIARAALTSDLAEVRPAYEDPRAHHALWLEVGGSSIFLVGGGTNGMEPHPLWDSLLNLADTGILFAAGFTQMLGVTRAEFEART